MISPVSAAKPANPRSAACWISDISIDIYKLLPPSALAPTSIPQSQRSLPKSFLCSVHLRAAWDVLQVFIDVLLEPRHPGLAE